MSYLAGRQGFDSKGGSRVSISLLQLPKELKNWVNDFNNLHNPIFEFLVLRQGRNFGLARWEASISEEGSPILGDSV